MAKASRKQSTPRSADFWRKHIDDWQASGLTQAEYCRQHKLSAGAFWHWKRRFSDQAEEAASNNKPNIVPIPVQQLTIKDARRPIILHSSGYRIELPGDFCRATLVKLLDTLGRIS